MANDHHQQTRDQRRPPSMDEVVHTFLENLKLRFGENSREVTTIYDILLKFRDAKMAKKDALTGIRMTLGDQKDLKEDLMNVLFHTDAAWGMSDFDFGQPPAVIQPEPQLLQPAQQPQMRLPPLCPSWYPDHQTHQPTGPVKPGSHEGYHSFGKPVFSPMQQQPIPFQRPNAFTSPVMAGPGSFPPYLGTGYDPGRLIAGHLSNHLPQPSHDQLQWERAEHNYGMIGHKGQAYSPLESNLVLERARSVASHFASPAPTNETHTSQGASSRRESYATMSPSILGNPVAVPIGQPVNDMPPPSTKRRRLASKAEQVSEDYTRNSGQATPAAPTSTQDSAVLQANIMATKAKTQPNVGGTFIHSLCGKSFASRSKVKKHHWGFKNDDLETTTGCWAKHNKPNVSWNEHPSCKEGAPPLRVAQKAVQPMLVQKDAIPKAPAAPSMMSTFESVPQAGVNAPNPYQDIQHRPQSVNPYHIHQAHYAAHSGINLDSLLPAVNVAASIDAPRPQGRIDSVASRLDTQAVAAERNRQYVASWCEASQGAREQGFVYGHQHPHAAHGPGIGYPLGGVHVPLDVALSTQSHANVYTPSPGPPTNLNWGSNHMVQTKGVGYYRQALPSPFPPHPDTNGRPN
ncbi:hypothetical protein BDW02DRAFT_616910 [Decorospora gaudefroyi]|uniref:Uncharacterized protein n=1 Tax=Decorospora gaudefroyi TaxID=184978 RepID=A0A6A5KLE3_9PLEO|nr:hypothetical protein BDW02DRAFT_616910 [Decorospora gaudefroyi]